MISVEKMGGSLNLHHAEFRGNADEIYTLRTNEIPNGSIYHCIDTDKDYMFDKENSRWYLHNTGGGGGNSGLSIYLWTSGSPYNVNDIVIKDNTMYICTVANSDTEWDASHWSALNSAEIESISTQEIDDLFD